MKQVATIYRPKLELIGNWLRVEEGDHKWLALILGTALAVRIAWTLVFQAPPSNDAAEYDGLAWRLASGQGYVTADGTPTAYRPVGYPAFLAALYLIFGHSWLIGGIANAFLGTASVVLTYRLAREALSSRLSLVAASVIALLPSYVMSYTSVLLTEALHTVLVLTALIVTCHLMRHPNWKNAALLGCILGLGVYVRPILILFPSVVALLILIQMEYVRTRIRMTLILAGITMAISLATILPWTARNFIVMGEPILTSTNGGGNFFIGNGPGATGMYRSIPPNTYSDPSELTRYREGYKLGLEYIANHPIEWLALIPKKFRHLWATDMYTLSTKTVPVQYTGIVPVLWVVGQVYWMVIALSAAAALLTKPIWSYWLKFPAVLLPLTLIYWTAFHMMFFGEGRFHAQMIPVVTIVSMHLLTSDRDWRSWLPQNTRLTVERTESLPG